MRTTKTFRQARERLRLLLAELHQLRLPDDPKILAFLTNAPAGALVTTCSDCGEIKTFPSQRGMHCAPEAFVRFHSARNCYYIKPLKNFVKASGPGSTDETGILATCREVNDFIIALKAWLKNPYPLKATEPFYAPVRADQGIDPLAVPDRYRWAYSLLDGRGSVRVAHETTLKRSNHDHNLLFLSLANLLTLVKYLPDYYTIETQHTNKAVVNKINQFTDWPIESYETEPGILGLRFTHNGAPVVLGAQIKYREKEQ